MQCVSVSVHGVYNALILALDHLVVKIIYFRKCWPNNEYGLKKVRSSTCLTKLKLFGSNFSAMLRILKHRSARVGDYGRGDNDRAFKQRGI